MSTFADNAVSRHKAHLRQEVAFLRRDGEWLFEFERQHPLLERPRLSVTMPCRTDKIEAQMRFEAAGYGDLFGDFWLCTYRRER